MHSEAKRFCPEPLNFAVTILRSCYSSTEEQSNWLALSPADVPAPAAKQNKNKTGRSANDNDNGEGANPNFPAYPSDIPNLSLTKIFNPENEEYLSSGEFKSAAAGVALRLIGRIAESLSSVDALPEIMAPAVEVLKNIVKAGGNTSNSGAANGVADGGVDGHGANGKAKKSKKAATKKLSATEEHHSKGITVAPGVAALAEEVLTKIASAVDVISSRRRPLFNKTLAAVPEARQFNPRYEDNFASGKDYDPDRERAERKKLQRELRREERGAARELRRDSVFMAGVRDKEKTNLQADLDASARRAMSFLEQQQADARSGGQGGHWKKNKRK